MTRHSREPHLWREERPEPEPEREQPEPEPPLLAQRRRRTVSGAAVLCRLGLLVLLAATSGAAAFEAAPAGAEPPPPDMMREDAPRGLDASSPEPRTDEQPNLLAEKRGLQAEEDAQLRQAKALEEQQEQEANAQLPAEPPTGAAEPEQACRCPPLQDDVVWRDGTLLESESDIARRREALDAAEATGDASEALQVCPPRPFSPLVVDSRTLLAERAECVRRCWRGWRGRLTHASARR